MRRRTARTQPQLLADGQQSDRDRTVVLTADAGDTVTCTFVNEKLDGLQVVAKTPKEQSVYIDQNVSYTLRGHQQRHADLHDVTVADDKCPGPAVRQADKTGNGDDVLEPGETWVYTCTVAASQIFTGDIAKVTNTVTVNAKDQRGQAVPPSKDTAVTNLLKPGIAIDKTGPATATAGDLVTYQLEVTEHRQHRRSTTAWSSSRDAQCQAPPALLSQERRRHAAVAQPRRDLDLLLPGADAGRPAARRQRRHRSTGTDKGGHKVTAEDTASTMLSQPAAAALPQTPIVNVPGTAKLRGTGRLRDGELRARVGQRQADQERDLHGQRQEGPHAHQAGQRQLLAARSRSAT